MTAITPAERQRQRRQRAVTIRCLTSDPGVVAAWERACQRHGGDKTAALKAAVLAYGAGSLRPHPSDVRRGAP